MAGILDLMNSDLGKTLVSGMSQQLGQKEDKTASAVSAAMPMILAALKRNAATPEGAKGLMGALDKKHDGSILDNLGSLLGKKEVEDDGAGILKHVFGAQKEERVAQAVSKSSGMDLASTMRILKMAAPVVMGYLGKQKRQNNVSDSAGIGNILGGLLGSQANQQQSMIEKLLDSDGDGSIVDDVAGMGMKFLGGLFKK